MFARRLGMFLPLVLLAASTALGQTTFATITGLITDSQGTLVPGATILAIHQRTNYRYSGASNDAGQYTLANLLEGVYTVRVSAPESAEEKHSRAQTSPLTRSPHIKSSASALPVASADCFANP